MVAGGRGPGVFGAARRAICVAGFLPTLRTLDRRWVFLLMFWAVLVPIYFVGVTGRTFPEIPSALAQATFDEIDRLHAGRSGLAFVRL